MIAPYVITTAAQARAARAMLGQGRADVAAGSGVSESSLKRIENPALGPASVSVYTLREVEEYFRAQGVAFLPGGEHQSPWGGRMDIAGGVILCAGTLRGDGEVSRTHKVRAAEVERGGSALKEDDAWISSRAAE